MKYVLFEVISFALVVIFRFFTKKQRSLINWSAYWTPKQAFVLPWQLQTNLYE
jgi:hypothetical protein